MRSDRIPLAASEPRCEPKAKCAMKLSCARAQAALPQRYASIADFTVEAGGGTALCPGYISIGAAIARAQSVKPQRKVHSPI